MKEIVVVCMLTHPLPVDNLHGKKIYRRLVAEPEIRARLSIVIVQRFPGPRLTIHIPTERQIVMKLDTLFLSKNIVFPDGALRLWTVLALGN